MDIRKFLKELPDNVKKDLVSKCYEIKKECNDLERLLDLAKKSPYAAASSDFLDRMELVVKMKAQDTDKASMCIAELEKNENSKDNPRD